MYDFCVLIVPKFHLCVTLQVAIFAGVENDKVNFHELDVGGTTYCPEGTM